MRHALKLHPESICPALSRIDVEVLRPRRGTLILHYVMTGAIGDVIIPPPTTSSRAEGLWQHTCFEAFLREPHHPAYYEFNLSPSMQWAAYRFDGYRSGMAAQEVDPPAIESWAADGEFHLRASLDIGGLRLDAAWRLGISAVIEERGGRKSYWALEHPAGKADFHHEVCFVLEPPAA